MKKKILIVVADYYKDVSKGLLNNVYNFFGNSYFLKQIKVPGIFEIPVTISKNIKKYDGFVALGCVIKGKTPHFEFISRATTDAISISESATNDKVSAISIFSNRSVSPIAKSEISASIF